MLKPCAEADPVVVSDERQLLERAQRGDSSAFGLLIHPHLDAIRRFAYSFARDWNDADDLAQEALIKAFRSLSAFESRSALTTWLYTVVRSVCQDHRRASARRASHLHDGLGPEDDIADQGELQDEELERKDEADALWAAIRCLPPEFRVCVVLFDIEGLSYEEIAEVEAVPIGTVRSRLSRGRGRLEKLLRMAATRLPAITEISGTRSGEPPSHSQGRLP